MSKEANPAPDISIDPLSLDTILYDIERFIERRERARIFDSRARHTMQILNQFLEERDATVEQVKKGQELIARLHFLESGVRS